VTLMARCASAQTVIPIVGPFESEAAVIIHDAHMGTLARMPSFCAPLIASAAVRLRLVPRPC
jgi:hypothetical protein